MGIMRGNSNLRSLVAVPYISPLFRPPVVVVALYLEVEGAVGGVEKPGPPLQNLLPNSGSILEERRTLVSDQL